MYGPFQVTSYWLPLIRQCSVGEKPVILAGNKVTTLARVWGGTSIGTYLQADLPYDSDTQSSHLQEILNTNLEVETGLEASPV